MNEITINNKILIRENNKSVWCNKLHCAHSRMIYHLKTGRRPRFGSRISITYFEFKRLEMHSWQPHAKHPTFEFGQQGDIGGKLKVDAGERGIEVQGTKGDGTIGGCI